MTPWSQDDLRRIGASDDFHISPYRPDRTTVNTPTWIWSVVVDDDVFVRAYNGTASRWYRAAKAQGAGHVRAAGLEKAVVFEPVDDAGNDRIDDAYRAKYAGSPYLAPMISDRARSATVRITLR